MTIAAAMTLVRAAYAAKDWTALAAALDALDAAIELTERT